MMINSNCISDDYLSVNNFYVITEQTPFGDLSLKSVLDCAACPCITEYLQEAGRLSAVSERWKEKLNQCIPDTTGNNFWYRVSGFFSQRISEQSRYLIYKWFNTLAMQEFTKSIPFKKTTTFLQCVRVSASHTIAPTTIITSRVVNALSRVSCISWIRLYSKPIHTYCTGDWFKRACNIDDLYN